MGKGVAVRTVSGGGERRGEGGNLGGHAPIPRDLPVLMVTIPRTPLGGFSPFHRLFPFLITPLLTGSLHPGHTSFDQTTPLCVGPAHPLSRPRPGPAPPLYSATLPALQPPLLFFYLPPLFPGLALSPRTVW